MFLLHIYFLNNYFAFLLLIYLLTGKILYVMEKDYFSVKYILLVGDLTIKTINNIITFKINFLIEFWFTFIYCYRFFQFHPFTYVTE